VVNKTISESTGYTPVELMFDEPPPDLFKELMTKTMDQMPQNESREQKALKAFSKMKQKAAKRKKKKRAGKFRWEPQVGDLILLKRQVTSDASANQISKFMVQYVGPMKISNIFPPSTYEVSELDGKVKGVFNKEALKPYIANT